MPATTMRVAFDAHQAECVAILKAKVSGVKKTPAPKTRVSDIHHRTSALVTKAAADGDGSDSADESGANSTTVELWNAASFLMGMATLGAATIASACHASHQDIYSKTLPLVSRLVPAFQVNGTVIADKFTEAQITQLLMIAKAIQDAAPPSTRRPTVNVRASKKRSAAESDDDNHRDISFGTDSLDPEVLSTKVAACHIGGKSRKIRYSISCIPARENVVAARLGKVLDARALTCPMANSQWFMRILRIPFTQPEAVKRSIVIGQLSSIMDFARREVASPLIIHDVVDAFSSVADTYALAYGDHDLLVDFNTITSSSVLFEWHRIYSSGLTAAGWPAAEAAREATSATLSRINLAFQTWQRHAALVLGNEFDSAWDAQPEDGDGATAAIPYGESPLRGLYNECVAAASLVIIRPWTGSSHATSKHPAKQSYGPQVAKKPRHSNNEGDTASNAIPKIRLGPKPNNAPILDMPVGETFPEWLVAARDCGLDPAQAMEAYPDLATLRTNRKGWCLGFFLSGRCRFRDRCWREHVAGGEATEVTVTAVKMPKA
jgi:hypothetical protein